MNRNRFPAFAWCALWYNVLVILWGAYVRATGSGAGCGNHWPLCDGQVVPRAKSVELLIEFSHRASSGLALIVAGIMVWWAFRVYEKGNRVRLGALWVLLLTISEALVGAGLVLFKLVAHDASVYRAVAISTHLANTFLLLAALTMTAHLASGGKNIRWSGQGAIGGAIGLALAAALLLGITGAVTALGDTLFPPSSVMQGIHQELSPTAHFLQRVRPLHPFIAMSVGLYILLIAGLTARLRASEDTHKYFQAIAFLFFCQIGLGLFNVVMLAPIWMQLLHLLVADLVWITLVMFAASALAEGTRRVEFGDRRLRDLEIASAADVLQSRQTGGQATIDTSDLGQAAGWKSYLALTKPRVISLLLFTTLTAMFIAADAVHRVTLPLFIAVAIGGYMAAGAANAINMVIDRDIDGRMKRTASRPTVTHEIPGWKAFLFALILEIGSFTLLWSAANLLCALLALAGLLFYVFVYTLALKRRTWHNIVIGGAAGAFPPLVGWAAVTGDLSMLAWYLFAIIFVWTPVHFWALALLIKDDYAAAGIPMLPVVLGERVTVIQIGIYAILTAMISILPFAQRQVGLIYLLPAVLLNVALLGRSLQLYLNPERPQAKLLFKYSMVYLALLFLVMAIDRSFRI